MDSRYQVLSNQKGALYAEGSPVILCAKALTKDNSNNKVLAQMRFKSISKDTLSGLTVVLAPKDAAGREIGASVQYSYLDLDVGRDEEFGSDKAIYFDDQTVRDYDVVIKECIFKNRVSQQIDKIMAAIVPQELGLSANQLSQYREDLNCVHAKYRYQVNCDIWQCTCGEFNHHDEQRCHHCNVSKAAIEIEPDLNNLQSEIDQREKADREEQEKVQEELRAKKEATQKKQKKIAIIAAICVAIIGVVIVVSNLIAGNIRTKELKQQIEDYISEGKYNEADSAITDSELGTDDKESYYLQIVSALYEDGDYAGTKEYADNVTSESGRNEIDTLQTSYYLAGSFKNQEEMDELTEICLQNGSVSQDKVDEVTHGFTFTSTEQLIDQKEWNAAWGKISQAFRDKDITDDDVEKWADVINKAINVAITENLYDRVHQFAKLKDEKCGTRDDTAELITTSIENAITNGDEAEDDVLNLITYKVSVYGYDDETTANQIEAIAHKIMDNDVKKGCELLYIVKDSPYVDEDPKEIDAWYRVSRDIDLGGVLIKEVIDARDNGVTTYPSKELQTIVDRALYLFDHYAGVYQYSPGKLMQYIVIEADNYYRGDYSGTLSYKCFYNAEDDALGSDYHGVLSEKEGKAYVGGYPGLKKISYGDLPNSYFDDVYPMSRRGSGY